MRWLDANGDPIERDNIALSLARLAGGRYEYVRARLLHDLAADVLPLVAARYHAWSGDIATAFEIRDRVRAATDSLLASPARDERDTVFRLATCTELERLATDLGDAQWAALLVRTARALRTTLAERPLTESTQRFASSVGVGTRPGFEMQPADYDSSAAAFAILGFTRGVLATEPDAARGRIRLRPQLRADWDALTIPQLRFGDGLISLTARRIDGGLQFRITQEAGAVPFTALLEPRIAAKVASIDIDGTHASLDVTEHAGISEVPVQLVLDDTRVLTVRFAEA